MRGVVVFLVGCAVLGFIMGVKGALPRGGVTSVASGPPAAPTSGVVIEAAPLEEAIVTPPAEEEKADEEEKAEPEKAKEPEKKAEPVEAPKAKTEPEPPPPAPKEEAPSDDPVGDLIAPPPPEAVIY